MAVRTQRPGTKLSTQVKGVIESALRLHLAKTSHAPQFNEVWTYAVEGSWTYAPSSRVIVEIHGETRFSRAWADYHGPLGRWRCELRAGAVRGTPREAGLQSCPLALEDAASYP